MTEVESTQAVPDQPAPRFTRLWPRLFVAAVTVAVCWYVVSVFQHRSAAKHALTVGKEALLRDELDEARGLFAEGLTHRPYNAELLLQSAKASRRSGRMDEARTSLKAALTAGAEAEAVEIERSLIAAGEGRYDVEEPYLLSRVQAKHPDAAAILEVAAKWYFLKFDLQKTNHCLKLWKELEPDSVAMWQLQGELSIRYHDGPQAIEAFREALRRSPGSWALRTALVGALLERKSNPEELKAMLDAMLAERPDDNQTLVRLGQAAEALGRPEEAAAFYDRALAKVPNDSNTLAARGALDLDQGHAAAALPRLESAVALMPGEQEQILYAYFRCLSRLGRTEEAKPIEVRWKKTTEDLKKLYDTVRLVSGNPNDPELRRSAGEICLRNRLVTDGLRWLNSALAVDPGHKATHKTLAEHYAKTGNTDLAKAHADAAGIVLPQ